MMDNIREKRHYFSYYLLIVLLTLDSAIRNSQELKPMYNEIEQFVTITIFIIMGEIGSLICIRLGRMLFIYITVVFTFIKGKNITRIAKLMLKI